MAELGVGYISIIPDVSKISPEIARAIDAAEGNVDGKGKSIGSRLAGGIGKTLKVGALGAGVAAGAGIATGLTKGMGRLTAIENAEAKLVGLGNSGREVSTIMDNALASVKGTAYGLDAAATTAAMAVASGVKPGKELEQVLKTVADTAGIAGASMDEMGMIFGSVAARGKLQGDDLMQLQSRGIPVLQMLAEQMGITAAEASKMVSEGKVDFETFERALRENVGGAALEVGNTLQGAYQNMWAAAGRAGATIQSSVVDVAKLGMREITAGIDHLDAKLKPLAATTKHFIDGTLVPGYEAAKKAAADFFSSNDFQAQVAGARAAFGEVVSAGKQLLPVVGNIGSALGQAGMQLGQAAWGAFSSALSAAASAASALSGPLTMVTGALANHPALVSAAVAAWAGFKYLPTITERASGSLQGFNDRIGGMRDQFNMVTPYANKLRETMAANGTEISKLDAKMVALGDTGTGTAQRMALAYTKASAPIKDYAQGQRELGRAAKTAALDASDGWVAADRIIAQAGRGMTATVTSMAGTVTGVGAAAFTGLKSAASNVVNYLGGPVNVGMMAAAAGIAVVGEASNRARAASEQYARSIASAADTNREFTAAVAGTSGALSEQAQELAKSVVESSTAGLKAFQTQVDGFLFKIPAPDTSDFTAAIAEMALGAEWQEKTLWRGSQNWEKYRSMVGEVNQANQEMGDYLKSTGRSMEDLSDIVAKGGPEFTALVEHMRGAGDGGQLLAGELVRAREELDLTVEAARRVDPAMVQASEAIDTLADSASSGQDKLSALHSLLQAMGLAPKDAEQAMMDAAAAVDEIVEAAEKANRPVEQLGDALFGMDGKLASTNESARDLHNRLMDMVGELEKVAANGGDVQAAFDGMAPAIAATAREFNLTEERVQELVAAYGGIPEVLVTGVALTGASETTKEIGEVWAGLEKMRSEGSATVEIGAVGDEAKAVMDELGIKWRETIGPDGEKNIEISATDDEAIASIHRVTQMASELGDREFSPKVLLDTTQLQVSASQASALLEALDIQDPTPQAKLIIEDLQKNQQIAVGDLAFLHAQSANPKADLDKTLLDAGVDLSKKQLQALDKVKAEPTIKTNNQPAKDGIQETKTLLGSIKDKVVNIFTRTHSSTGGTGSFNADGSVRYAANGLLSQQQPQIAAGGRWITWAEDETQGESFIPHAPSKRKRSTQILAETAHIFGLGLVDAGGNAVRRDGTSVAPTSRSFMADGGITAADVLRFVKGENVGGKQAPRSLEGAPYVWGGGLLGNWGDCSGAMSGIAAFIVDAPLQGRKFATMNQGSVLSSMGAKSGLGSGPRMAFGWFNGGPYGGHTSGTLHFGDGESINLEMGGGRGNGQIGGAAAGAGHGQYTNHAHLPLAGSTSAEIGDVSEVESTSTSGVTLKDGRTVSWGKAQTLFEQAQQYVSGPKYFGRDVRGAIADAMRLFDSGGVWKHGQIGVNLSGADEYVFTNQSMKDFRGATGEIREAAAELRVAAAGGDWGYGATAGLLGEEDARKLVNAAGDFGVAAEELSEAFRGGDWGYGGLSNLIGEDNARAAVNVFAAAGDAVEGLSSIVARGVGQVDAAVLRFGRNLGGDFIGSTEIVQDAERGLYETRANISVQAENITKAEQELADARKALVETEAGGGGLDTSHRRKLQDAEEALVKARESGKPDKIADAEKRLARAREDADAYLEKSADKNAKEVRKAQEAVNKAEDKLRSTRDAHRKALADLEAAERTTIAARYQAISELGTSIGAEVGNAMSAISGLFSEFGRLATVVEDLQQNVSKLHMQQKMASMQQLSSLADYQVKSRDVQRARLRGLIGVAQAERTLEEARESAQRAGLTSIEAMAGAMDRYYETGIFAIEMLTEAEIENTREVQEALWGVEVARKQAALDELEAARAREIAGFRVAEATLAQTKAAQLLELQTQQLAQTAAQLYGMTSSQAQGAALGFEGAGRAARGAGGIVGGLAGAAAGFAVGGPLGAIPGLIGAFKGLGDTIKGAQQAKANRREMDEAWRNMGTGSRAAIVGGSILGAGAAGAGGILGGAQGAQLGAQLGAEIVSATVGSVQNKISVELDAMQRRFADRQKQLEADFTKREHELNMRSLDKEIDYIYAKDRAESQLNYATMMKEAVAAPTDRLEKAFKDAADAEKVRAQQMHEEQMRYQQESQRIQADQLATARQVPALLGKINDSLRDQPRSAVSGVSYYG